MKHVKLFEQFLNEVTIAPFKAKKLSRKDRIDTKFFMKLMPKTAKTSLDAEAHINSFSDTMFAHYQYFDVKPNGNSPDRPTYRIMNDQYWLNDTQLKWQGRPGDSVDVTLLTISDITDPDNRISLGSVYVHTPTYLKEQEVVFEILDKKS